MQNPRLLYKNWIVELGRDPRHQNIRQSLTQADSLRRRRIKREVHKAVAELPPTERYLIEQFYFEFRSLPEISGTTGRSPKRLHKLKKRAMARLKSALAAFVWEEFGIITKTETSATCPICRSPLRQKIEKIIESKPPHRTWRDTIQKIKKECGLAIATPQTVIGHHKYHINKEGD